MVFGQRVEKRSRGLAGAVWGQCMPSGLRGLRGVLCLEIAANLLVFGCRRVLPARKSAKVFSGEDITDRLVVLKSNLRGDLISAD